MTRILGLNVHRVDMDGAVACVLGLVRSGGTRQVVTLNAEMAVRAAADPAFAEIVNRADLVVPDGIGVVWAARVLGEPVPGRVAGFDLMQELVAVAEREGWPVFLLGAAPGVAESAAACLVARLPRLKLAGVHHGYFSESQGPDVAAMVRASGARLVFVAMGSPRQETWIARNAQRLGDCVCMGVGGSLDVLAGKASRAPAWVRRAGLEWLYRVASQPARLRRALALPRFVWLVLAQTRIWQVFSRSAPK